MTTPDPRAVAREIVDKAFARASHHKTGRAAYELDFTLEGERILTEEIAAALTAAAHDAAEAMRERAARIVDPIPPDDREPTDEPLVEALREFSQHWATRIRALPLEPDQKETGDG